MNLTTEHIARLCHEVNRAYCQALGDNSQTPWDEAPEWQRESARQGVRLHTDHPQAGPRTSHESWLQHKLSEGWSYGETKDPQKKQHPCMVPFDQLPCTQQAKDFIFHAIVTTLTAMTTEPSSSTSDVDIQLRLPTALCDSLGAMARDLGVKTEELVIQALHEYANTSPKKWVYHRGPSIHERYSALTTQEALEEYDQKVVKYPGCTEGYVVVVSDCLRYSQSYTFTTREQLQALLDSPLRAMAEQAVHSEDAR